MAQIDEATDVKQFKLTKGFQEEFDKWKTEIATPYRALPGFNEERPVKGILRILGEEPIVTNGSTTGLLIFYRVDAYKEQTQ